MEGPVDHYRRACCTHTVSRLPVFSPGPLTHTPSALVQSLLVGFVPALLSLHSIPDARHRAASANLAQARADARTFGDERRAAIRARVAELERGREDEEESPT